MLCHKHFEKTVINKYTTFIAKTYNGHYYFAFDLLGRPEPKSVHVNDAFVLNLICRWCGVIYRYSCYI